MGREIPRPAGLPDRLGPARCRGGRSSGLDEVSSHRPHRLGAPGRVQDGRTRTALLHRFQGTDPEELATAVRSHWTIENRLYWVLDVTMGEDGSTVRKDKAPQNLFRLKKIALNLIRQDSTDPVKCSLRIKRKRAAWDDDVRMNMLGLKSL